MKNLLSHWIIYLFGVWDFLFSFFVSVSLASFATCQVQSKFKEKKKNKKKCSKLLPMPTISTGTDGKYLLKLLNKYPELWFCFFHHRLSSNLVKNFNQYDDDEFLFHKYKLRNFVSISTLSASQIWIIFYLIIFCYCEVFIYLFFCWFFCCCCLKPNK